MIIFFTSYALCVIIIPSCHHCFQKSLSLSLSPSLSLSLSLSLYHMRMEIQTQYPAIYLHFFFSVYIHSFIPFSTHKAPLPLHLPHPARPLLLSLSLLLSFSPSENNQKIYRNWRKEWNKMCMCPELLQSLPRCSTVFRGRRLKRFNVQVRRLNRFFPSQSLSISPHPPPPFSVSFSNEVVNETGWDLEEPEKNQKTRPWWWWGWSQRWR